MRVINPYAGVDFGKTVKSITHEHIHSAGQWTKAYERGIRHFAAMSYSPAAPRFPASNYLFKIVDGVPVFNTYKDYANLPNNDYTIVDKRLEGAVEEFKDSEGNIVKTDDLPQVPNNEHPTFTQQLGVTTNFIQHFNVLGNMWGEAGWGDNNGSIADRNGHPLSDLSDMTKFLDASNQYFAGGKVFGTINHCGNLSSAKMLIGSELGKIPLGFEVFNQGYTRDLNRKYRDCYDKLLSEGYRLFAVSVIDWQGYIEKDYADEEYIADVDYDRGCNVLLVDSSYDSLPANDFMVVDGKKYPNYHSATYTKAEAGLDCYINGRFYASGLGNHSITELSEKNGTINFSVDGSPSGMAVITNLGRTSVAGNSLSYSIEKGVSYVRFEVFYDNDEKKDFIFTNPIWVEDNDIAENKSKKIKRNLLLILE